MDRAGAAHDAAAGNDKHRRQWHQPGGECVAVPLLGGAPGVESKLWKRRGLVDVDGAGCGRKLVNKFRNAQELGRPPLRSAQREQRVVGKNVFSPASRSSWGKG